MAITELERTENLPDYGGMVEVAKAIYQKVVGDVRLQMKELENRLTQKFAKALEQGISELEQGQKDILSESLERFKSLIKALPPPNVSFAVPENALHVQVENAVPVQVNVPSRLVKKSFTYDAAGRPLNVIESEIKEPSHSKE